jgi:glycosyl transferase family 25
MIPEPTITFVTAFIDLNEDRSRDKSPETRISLFKKLAKAGLSICLYVSSTYEKIGKELANEFTNVKLMEITNLEDTETYKIINDLNPSLPVVRTDYHDTRNFLILMNAKVEFVYNATLVNPFKTDNFAWIDFSICHVITDLDKPNNILSRLYFIANSKLNELNIMDQEMVLFPSCWDKEKTSQNMNTISTTINWRFCGGFFIGNKYSIKEFYLLTLLKLPQFIEHTGVNILSWEVNFWAWLEHHDYNHSKNNASENSKNINFEINNYTADHNNSMLEIPLSYINIVASLTSIPSRINKCKLVIDSLINQVNHIYLNLCFEYKRFGKFDILTSIPDFLIEEPYKSKVTITYGKDHGPATKYLGALSYIQQSQWIFFCDDDQEYHPYLISTMLNAVNQIGVYQNRYNIVKKGSGGIIHGYVGNIIHRSLLNNLNVFPLPENAKFIDDQWMSIYCFLQNINIYPSGIEDYIHIFSVLENGYEKIGLDSLSSLCNRDEKIKEIENYFNVKFINDGKIISNNNINSILVPEPISDNIIKKYKTTIVTFYFNIKKLKDATDSVRPQSFYMEKGKATLKLPYPMVVFCDDSTYDEIKKIRDEYFPNPEMTNYIIRNLVEYDFYIDNWDTIFNNRINRDCYKDSRNTPSYYLVCMFKILALYIAKKQNFYNTDYFAWVDFGGSHVMKDFHDSVIKMLDNPNPMVSFCYIHYRSHEELKSMAKFLEYGGPCGVAATSFTVETQYLEMFYNNIMNIFYETLYNGVGHCDEQILTYFYDRYPELCTLYYGDYYSILTNYHEPINDHDAIINYFINQTFQKGRKDLAEICSKKLINTIEKYKLDICPQKLHYIKGILPKEKTNNIIISKYIDKVVYINLEHRTDRREHIENTLNNFCIPFERFNAIRTKGVGFIGCARSHLEVLKMARRNNYKNVLILEDDFTFIVSKEEFDTNIELLFNNKPDFDVCMINYNLIHGELCVEYPFLTKVIESQTASGYIVNNTIYDRLINIYEESIILLEATHKHWIYTNDQSWKKLQPITNWYCFTKKMGTQIEGVSNTGSD